MDETLSEDRWLPSSPHREEIVKVIEAGRAHIEERGHNVPPLLVFEDGGAIELSSVRYKMTRRGMQLVAADDSTSSNETSHSDVCGSMDELKGLLKDTPELSASDLALLGRLLENACYMISRMHRRSRRYKAFAADVASLCKCIAEIQEPDPEKAYEKAAEIRNILRDSPEMVAHRKEEICEFAEGIRKVAGKLESCLSRSKEAARGIGGSYIDIKGGRKWSTEEANAS